MGLSILAMCDEESATVPPEASAADAIKLMLERLVGAVGVVDKQGNVTGIFTERDVLKKLALSGRDPAKTQVKELMSAPVQTITEKTSPGEALVTMMGRHFRHLPIVDRQGKLLGILSLRNLLQSQVDELRHDLDSLEQYVSNDGPGG